MLENVLPYGVYLSMKDKSNGYETDNLVAAFADRRVAQQFVDDYTNNKERPSDNFEYRYWIKNLPEYTA